MLKNKEGKVRSGWIILLTMVAGFGLLTALTTVIQIPIVSYLTSTGDYDLATQYASDKAIRIINIYSYVSMFLQELVMIIIPILAWTKFVKEPISSMGLKPIKEHKKELLFGLLFGFVSITIVFAAIVLSGNAVVTSWKPTFSVGMIVWFVIFIFVGFAEEIFGRGFIMAALRRTKNKWMVLIISAAIFSLMHSGNQGIGLIPYLNIVLVGVLFGFMYYLSGNIWMCIGYHITWNFFQGFYGFPVSGSGTPSLFQMEYVTDTVWNGGTFGPEGGLFVSIIILFGLILVLRYYKNSDYDFMSELPKEEPEVMDDVSIDNAIR